MWTSDRLILTKENSSYIVELTVGYEINLRNNIHRKYANEEQKKKYRSVKFIVLSISALGVSDKESGAFINILERFISFDRSDVKYFIRKIINITIRSTYYTFCCRNKE